jgi:predicted RNA binding protein YcfA (HicA-like mRNA interferase family)
VKAVSGKRMCRIMKKRAGFSFASKAVITHFLHAGKEGTIFVPVHANRDLKPGTQRGIMKDAGLAPGDL